MVKLLDIPLDILISHLVYFLTFQDMGKLIMTSKKCKNIFDSKDIWRNILQYICAKICIFMKVKKFIYLYI